MKTLISKLLASFTLGNPSTTDTVFSPLLMIARSVAGLLTARVNFYVSSYYPNRIHIISPDLNIELLIEDKTGEMLNQPTNLAFEPNGTRLFFANLGGQHVGAFDVGEVGAPLQYPKL